MGKREPPGRVDGYQSFYDYSSGILQRFFYGDRYVLAVLSAVPIFLPRILQRETFVAFSFSSFGAAVCAAYISVSI